METRKKGDGSTGLRIAIGGRLSLEMSSIASDFDPISGSSSLVIHA
jgi:hypothetical protein